MQATNATRSALVLMEFQNEFLSEGGKLHAPVATVVQENRVLERANELSASARERKIPVVHVMMEFLAGHRELPAKPYGILGLVAETRAFERGTWGAELHPDLEARPEDIVVAGKRTISSFDSTNLATVLSGLGTTRVFLAGQLTNLCVESTMRSAYDRGFEVFTVTDAMSTLSMDLHRNAVDNIFPFFSRPILTSQFGDSVDSV